MTRSKDNAMLQKEGGNGSLKILLKTQICLYSLKCILFPGMVIGYLQIFKNGYHMVLYLMVNVDSPANPKEW